MCPISWHPYRLLLYVATMNRSPWVPGNYKKNFGVGTYSPTRRPRIPLFKGGKSVIRLSLGRRLVNLLPVAQRTNAFTNGVVGRTQRRGSSSPSSGDPYNSEKAGASCWSPRTWHTDNNFGLRAEDTAPRSFAPRDSGRRIRVRTRREVRLEPSACCAATLQRS